MVIMLHYVPRHMHHDYWDVLDFRLLLASVTDVSFWEIGYLTSSIHFHDTCRVKLDDVAYGEVGSHCHS